MAQQEIIDSIMTITVEVEGNLIKRNLKEDLRMDGASIDDALFKSAGITAYWHMLYQKHSNRVQKAKVALDRLKAEIGHKIRSAAKEDGERVTDKSVEEQIIIDKEFQALEDRYLELQDTLNILKAGIEAIKEKRSALISISANMRTTGTLAGPKKSYDTYIDEIEGVTDSMESFRQKLEARKEHTESGPEQYLITEPEENPYTKPVDHSPKLKELAEEVVKAQDSDLRSEKQIVEDMVKSDQQKEPKEEAPSNILTALRKASKA